MNGRRFDGRTVIVTGGGGVIGATVSARLAALGAAVFVVDSDAAAAQRVASDICADGGRAAAWQADVTNEDAVRSYAAEAADYGRGRVDGFFNNAGIEGDVAAVTEYEVASFDRVCAVNVRGVFLGMKLVLPYMSSGAVVVNTASTAGLKGSPGNIAYVASKHAVIGMTKVAALENAPLGIRVCAIAPGPVESRMMDSLRASRAALPNSSAAASKVATVAGEGRARWATPVEVASGVVYLLSDEAAMVSGSVLVLDGGSTAR